MSAPPPIDQWPGLPLDAEGPVFSAPWQAQAFAMTLSLFERGVFTWPEWTNALAAQIAAGHATAESPSSGEPGEDYYRHWLNALEALVAAKGLTSERELARYQRAWQRAAERTAHGAPIVLQDHDLEP